MTYVFYFIISFSILLVQTVILANPSFVRHAYDIMLILIVYSGLFRPAAEGLSLVFLTGVFMDGLSGGSFWTHTTSYFWFLLILKWMIQFLNAGSIILLPFTILIGILFENAIFVLASKGSDLSAGLSADTIQNIFSQITWGITTGPPAVLLIKKIHELFGASVWSGDRSQKKNSSGSIESGQA